MRDLRTDGPEARRRAAAREAEAANGPEHMVLAGVSNHLLARALSTGNSPAGATLQRYFTHKRNVIDDKAKLPTIHGASANDLKKLADDTVNDYGAILDKDSVVAAMKKYEANHTVVAPVLALDESMTGHLTVWNDDAFALHAGQPVRATFQLDWNQGKHDTQFAPSEGDPRHKAGGQKMPPGSDYATLAQGVPAELAKARLTQIFAKAAGTKLDFSVQKKIQADGLQYEMSAKWAPLAAGRHVLVYYHCYPPR
jgi:hypothetical protein